MLEAMTKFGGYRVDYLHHGLEKDQKAFAFYLRAEIITGDSYSREAKRQLYTGLTIIKQHLEFNHLAGIYLDVDSLDNLNRPAYLQMKQDMLKGMFKRLFVLDERAVMGNPDADHDMLMLFIHTRGFELFTCKNGECLPLELLRVLEPLGV
ncbi:MAG: hypothetical protein CVU43_13600 [Chloroflexi bacterium HGW-Chloroflexi-5]|jgi:hypothetical protein|nr:MAG: hypothetical protein CVU43_13600 [Chloroflexi bacterium HGW-Chloroflexi-5]